MGQLLPFSCSSGKESRKQRFTPLCLWKARGDGDEKGESRGGGSGVTEARTHAGGRTQVREPVAERSRAEVTMTMMLPHRRLRLRLPRPLCGPGDTMRSPQGQEGSAGCRGSALPRSKVPMGLPHKRCCPNRTRGAGMGRVAPPRSGRFHGSVLPLCVSISRMEIANVTAVPRAPAHTWTYLWGKPSLLQQLSDCSTKPAIPKLRVPTSLLSLEVSPALRASGAGLIPHRAEGDPNPAAQRGTDPT